jgi:hypothetical protein
MGIGLKQARELSVALFGNESDFELRLDAHLARGREKR